MLNSPTTSVPASETALLEVSIVMPCLNEAETLGICIEKAQSYLAQHNISGEIIIADNGSTDGSIDIAKQMDAVVFTYSQGTHATLLIRRNYYWLPDCESILKNQVWVEKLL